MREQAIVDAPMTDAEDDRLRQRHSLRLAVAKLALVESKANDLVAQIHDIDTALDLAAEQHEERCAPLQSELRKIEAELATIMANRAPLPPGLEARRVALLREIGAANAALAAESERQNTARAALVESEEKLRFQIADRAVMELDLAKSPLGNPRLMAQRFVAERVAWWAGMRENAARKMCTDLDSRIHEELKYNGVAAADRIRPRLADWRAELAAAVSAAEEARTASDRAYRAVIEE